MERLYIFYLFIFILEALVFLQYCSSIFVPKYSFGVRSLFIISSYVIIFIVLKFGYPMVNFFFLCLANFLFLYFLHNTLWYIAAFHAVINIILMSLWEAIVILIAPHPYTYHSFESFGVWIVPTILSKFLFIMTMLILEIFVNRYSSQSATPKPPLFLLVPPVISMYFICCYIQFAAEAKLSSNLIVMLIIAIVLLFILNLSVITLYNYITKKNTEYTELQISLQREHDISEYYKVLSVETESKNRFIHDIKKHLQSIAILNQNKEPEKIAAYINTLIHSSELQTSTHFCNHELLNAILCRYFVQCQNSGIDFRTDVRKNTCTFLAEADITALFCNLLDNAFEAAQHIQASFIELTVHQQEQTSFTIITLINSCRKNPFTESGKTLKTTKTDKLLHGHGINIIQRTADRYHGTINYYYSEDAHEFHTIIVLKSTIKF